jgi:hypothetical protein
MNFKFIFSDIIQRTSAKFCTSNFLPILNFFAMKNIKVLCIFCGIFHLMSFAHDPIKTTMSSILATAKTDAKLSYSQQMPQFINHLNYKLPVLRKLEFKVGTEDFDLTSQQYGISISPNTLGQMRRQEEMKATEIRVSEAENNVYIHQALVERYQALVDVNYATVLNQKEKVLETLLTQKNTTLKSMIQRGVEVRIKDIADTENDRYAVQLALLQLETNIASSTEKLRQFVGTSNEILVNFDNMMHVNDMEKIINTIKTYQTIQTPEISLAKTETQAKRAALSLENASNKEILSSIQIVDAPRANDFFNNFGVRFTLSVPLTGNTRLKRNELIIDLKKAENKENILRLNNQKDVQYQLVKIENLIKKYRIYADKSENSLIKSLLNNARLTAEMSATELLDLKLTQQKTEVELAKIEYDITNEYIALLSSTNLLGSAPLKNYLSSGLDVF